MFWTLGFLLSLGRDPRTEPLFFNLPTCLVYVNSISIPSALEIWATVAFAAHSNQECFLPPHLYTTNTTWTSLKRFMEICTSSSHNAYAYLLIHQQHITCWLIVYFAVVLFIVVLWFNKCSSPIFMCGESVTEGFSQEIFFPRCRQTRKNICMLTPILNLYQIYLLQCHLKTIDFVLLLIILPFYRTCASLPLSFFSWLSLL